MTSIPVWSTMETSKPDRESQLQTRYSPKWPTILVCRVLLSIPIMAIDASRQENGLQVPKVTVHEPIEDFYFELHNSFDVPTFENRASHFAGSTFGSLRADDIDAKSEAQRLWLNNHDVFCAGSKLVESCPFHILYSPSSDTDLLAGDNIFGPNLTSNHGFHDSTGKIAFNEYSVVIRAVCLVMDATV